MSKSFWIIAIILVLITGLMIAAIHYLHPSIQLTGNYSRPAINSSTLIDLVISLKLSTSRSQVNLATSWFTQRGFKMRNYKTGTSEIFIDFQGTQQQIFDTFHKKINSYCPSVFMSIPVELSSTVQYIFTPPCPSLN